MAFSFDFSDMLNSTATVETPTVVKDTGGGYTNTWATSISDVAVSLQPLGGSKIEDMGKLGITVDHVAYTSSVLAIANGDRLVVDGLKYAVQYTRNEGGTGEVFAIYAKLVTE